MTKTMKNRVIRVSDDIWEAAQTQAQAKGITISTAVRKFLLSYGSNHLPHSTVVVNMLIPVDHDTSTLKNTRDEALAAMRRTAALENRAVVEDSLELVESQPYSYTKGSGETVTGEELVMKYEADTVPSK